MVPPKYNPSANLGKFLHPAKMAAPMLPIMKVTPPAGRNPVGPVVKAQMPIRRPMK